MLPRALVALLLVLLVLRPPVVAAFLVRLPAAVTGARRAFLVQPRAHHHHCRCYHHRHRRPSATTTMAATASSSGAGDDRATLLLATTEDKASRNLVNALLQRGGWEPHDVPSIDGLVWKQLKARTPTFLWQIEKGFLSADFLDTEWVTATSQPLQGPSHACACWCLERPTRSLSIALGPRWMVG